MRCEGKINRVGQEMDLSYPAVRSRLTDVIEALGYEVGESSRSVITPEKRRDVLAQVSAGEISADEAVDILRGE
jgi:hypothetical protein